MQPQKYCLHILQNIVLLQILLLFSRCSTRVSCIPNISETQSISKLAYSGFIFVSVFLLKSCKAAQLVFKAGLVAPAKVVTVDFWQAKPPQWQPYYRHALSTATVFYSIRYRQDSGFARRGEYNVENLKLLRDHHENFKTHPKEKNIFIYLCFNNKRACQIFFP